MTAIVDAHAEATVDPHPLMRPEYAQLIAGQWVGGDRGSLIDVANPC
jgi:hypothetical protein